MLGMAMMMMMMTTTTMMMKAVQQRLPLAVKEATLGQELS
jgi:hypothetical protein